MLQIGTAGFSLISSRQDIFGSSYPAHLFKSVTGNILPINFTPGIPFMLPQVLRYFPIVGFE